MTDFIYPQNVEINEIAQDKLPNLIANRPVFDFFPIQDSDRSLVSWEQRDNYVGLQQIRGIDGRPPRVAHTGLSRYFFEPGVYGEFELLSEQDLTEMRAPGTFGDIYDVTRQVVDIQDKLLTRRLDRVESVIWNLLVNGTFSVTGPFGAVLASDTYTTQTFTSAVPWGTAGSATPLADLRAVMLKHRGHSVSFGAGAKAYLNQVTLNELLSNTNTADFYGRRMAGLATANNLRDINSILTADGLPELVPYDEGYLNESRSFVPFIPNGVVVVIGRRADGSPVGAYKMTRNANKPNMAPGAYMRVIDKGEDDVPRQIQVHDGHNGGPAIYFPSAIVAMSVS